MDSKNIKYLILTIILLILSVFGVILILEIVNSTVNSNSEPTESIPTPTEVISTPTPIITIAPIATVTPKVSSSSSTIKPTITPTSTATPTATPTAIPTIRLTITPILTPTSTSSVSPSLLNFKSVEDGFSIFYSSLRKLYQDKESTGNRYTFASSSGNFAVHVAPSGTWAWTNTDRNFSATLIVSGQNTYRYDIATQTIVDLQSSTKNYTIQCVHNGIEAQKTECEALIRSFQLL